MPTVFISHAASDRGFVEGEIVPFFECIGIHTVLSMGEGTADFQKLHKCDWFSVILSKRAIESELVSSEVIWALSYRRNATVPVVIESCDPTELHGDLESIEHVDACDPRGNWKERLLDLLPTRESEFLPTANADEAFYEDVFHEAQTAFDMRNYDEVIRLVESIPSEERTGQINDLRKSAHARKLTCQATFLEIKQALEVEEYDGLLGKIDSLLNLLTRNDTRWHFAEKLREYVLERNSSLVVAKRYLGQLDYESAARSLDRVHPSLCDEAVTKTRNAAGRKLAAIRKICTEMEAANSDDDFAATLEMLWELLPDLAGSSLPSLPIEFERQISQAMSKTENSVPFPKRLLPHVRSFAMANPDCVTAATLEQRLSAWIESDALWHKIEARVEDRKSAIGVWSSINDFLLMRLNDEEAIKRVDKLCGQWGWQVHCLYGHEASIQDVWFSLDDRIVSSRDREGAVYSWDIGTGQIVPSKFERPGNRQTWFSSDGLGGIQISGREVHRFDSATKEVIWTFPGHTQHVLDANFSWDGRFVATASRDSSIRLLNAQTGELFQEIQNHSGAVTNVRISPDSRFIISSGKDNTVRIWDIDAASERICISSARDQLRCLKFATQSHTVAAWIDAKHQIVTAPIDQGRVQRFGHRVNSLDISYDGGFVAGGCVDNRVIMWNSLSGEEVRVFDRHEYSVKSVVFSPDARYLLSGSEDETVRLWHIDSGNESRRFLGHKVSQLDRAFFGCPGYVNCVAICSNGLYAASGSEDKTVRIWFLGCVDNEVV